MAESTFRIPSTITIDNIVLNASSPLDSEVLVFDGTSFVADSVVPFGTIEMWAGLSSSIPSGWLLCNGQSLNTFTYRTLHSFISNRYGGTAYSAGTTDQSGAVTTFNVPDMTAYIPFGITSSGTAGATTSSFGDASLAHNHTTDANATTSADGSNHSHSLSSGGAHNHSLVVANWNHYHDSGAVGSTHRHNIGTANQPSTPATGLTAHDATQHSYFNTDNAQTHSHTTGNQNSNANHGHTIPTGGSPGTHTHTWSTSSTSNTANQTAHNHTLNIVPICFIIKF